MAVDLAGLALGIGVVIGVIALGLIHGQAVLVRGVSAVVVGGLSYLAIKTR